MREHSLAEEATVVQGVIRSSWVRAVPMLAGLPEEFLGRIRSYATLWQAQLDRPLYFKDDPENFVAFILCGSVHHVLRGADGRELIHDSNAAGELVGEAALFDSQKRSSAAFATAGSELMLVARSHFSWLHAEPEFLKRAQKLLCQRLRDAAEFTESIGMYCLESRLARHILHQAQLHGVTAQDGIVVPLPGNQSTLASMVNASRPKLNVQLRQWRRSGLIRSQKTSLVISDLEQLKRIARAA